MSYLTGGFPQNTNIIYDNPFSDFGMIPGFNEFKRKRCEDSLDPNKRNKPQPQLNKRKFDCVQQFNKSAKYFQTISDFPFIPRGGETVPCHPTSTSSLSST